MLMMLTNEVLLYTLLMMLTNEVLLYTLLMMLTNAVLLYTLLMMLTNEVLLYTLLMMLTNAVLLYTFSCARFIIVSRMPASRSRISTPLSDTFYSDKTDNNTRICPISSNVCFNINSDRPYNSIGNHGVSHIASTKFNVLLPHAS